MPFLSIRRKAALETRRRTQRFSLSTQKRRYCRFGKNRRLVLLLAWETLFPTMGPLPVTSQTRAMWTLRYFLNSWCQMSFAKSTKACMAASDVSFAKLKAVQPHLARRVAVTHFVGPPHRECSAKPWIIASFLGQSQAKWPKKCLKGWQPALGMLQIHPKERGIRRLLAPKSAGHLRQPYSLFPHW